jgi:hypothetical protein
MRGRYEVKLMGFVNSIYLPTGGWAAVSSGTHGCAWIACLCVVWVRQILLSL